MFTSTTLQLFHWAVGSLTTARKGHTVMVQATDQLDEPCMSPIQLQSVDFIRVSPRGRSPGHAVPSVAVIALRAC